MFACPLLGGALSQSAMRAFIFLTAASVCAADLTHATVIAPATFTAPERKAVSLLVDSVRERSDLSG